jgi:O-antigen/teichoic acid export membrane protein
VIRWVHISESLRYAVPVVIGYVAYFVLNRVSTLILQRHVAVEQVAIFGLAQQLAMVLAIAATAFGKALQPTVFAAEPAQAAILMRRSGNILMLLMFFITSTVVLFSSNIFSMIAPKSYAGGYEILLVLLIGTYAYSFTVISNTALLYHRRPKAAVTITIIGAVLSATLGFWLIPLYHLHGAAIGILGALLTMTLASNWMASRVAGLSNHRPMLLAIASVSIMAFFAAWLRNQGFSIITELTMKIIVNLLILAGTYLMYLRKQHVKSCVA